MMRFEAVCFITNSQKIAFPMEVVCSGAVKSNAFCLQRGYIFAWLHVGALPAQVFEH